MLRFIFAQDLSNRCWLLGCCNWYPSVLQSWETKDTRHYMGCTLCDWKYNADLPWWFPVHFRNYRWLLQKALPLVNSFTVIQLSSSLLLSYVNIHQQGLSEICWSTVNASCGKYKKCYPSRVDFFFPNLYLLQVVRAVFERTSFSRFCNRDFYWDSLVKIVTGLLRRLLGITCLHPGQAFK